MKNRHVRIVLSLLCMGGASCGGSGSPGAGHPGVTGSGGGPGKTGVAGAAGNVGIGPGNSGGTSGLGGAIGSGGVPGGAGHGGSPGTGGASTGGESGAGSGGAGGGGLDTSGEGGAGGGSSQTGPAIDWSRPVSGGPTGSGVAVSVVVDPTKTVGRVGPGFGGFSYEKGHITNASLTGQNAQLIALYKLLGAPVIRLGADDVDHCNWVGTGAAPTKPSGAPFSRSINTGMVDQLCAFLGATGARVIYGLNYKSGDVTASAAEAAYVMQKCGGSIYGFELGNEINRYGSWASLKSSWEAMAKAVAVAPGALLVGPAGGGGDALSLSTPFAADESATFGNKLVLLTQHYYAGTAGTATATVSRLQTPDYASPTSQVGLIGTESTMNKAAMAHNIRDGYRCGECNTFSAHGEMGISDALIAGLWGLDLIFVTAEQGGSGINLHGGETGMDGTKPFYYEPIQENQGAVVQAQPIYYSMLLLNAAGQGPVVSTTATTANPNFTAYAVKTPDFISVVLDNKSATGGAQATIDVGGSVKTAGAVYLAGTPAGTLTAAATAVTFAGASVSPDGVWKPAPPYAQTVSGSTVSVFVPPATAALVRVVQ